MSESNNDSVNVSVTKPASSETEYRPIAFPKATMDNLLKLPAKVRSNAIVLYVFYIYMTVWQRTNSVYCTNTFAAGKTKEHGLGWSEKTVRKAREALIENGLIKVVRKKNKHEHKDNYLHSYIGVTYCFREKTANDAVSQAIIAELQSDIDCLAQENAELKKELGKKESPTLSTPLSSPTNAYNNNNINASNNDNKSEPIGSQVFIEQKKYSLKPLPLEQTSSVKPISLSIYSPASSENEVLNKSSNVRNTPHKNYKYEAVKKDIGSVVLPPLDKETCEATGLTTNTTGFDVDSEPFRLALCLLNSIKNRSAMCEPVFKTWPKKIHKLLDKYKQTPECIEQVIIACATNKHWAGRILDMTSFYKYYDKMKIQLGIVNPLGINTPIKLSNTASLVFIKYNNKFCSASYDECDCDIELKDSKMAGYMQKAGEMVDEFVKVTNFDTKKVVDRLLKYLEKKKYGADVNPWGLALGCVWSAVIQSYKGSLNSTATKNGVTAFLNKYVN